MLFSNLSIEFILRSEFESLDKLLSQRGEQQAKLQRMETKLAMGLSEEDAAVEVEKPKIGTWDGVFASCILNIFGVIMFLRLPWVIFESFPKLKYSQNMQKLENLYSNRIRPSRFRFW